METMRAFIAVDLGEEIRNQLFELQRKLKKSHADVRWVKPKAMHLTLAFLGDVDVETIAPLEQAMDRALENQKAFKLKAAGTGTFGKPSHPRVLWAGIDPSPPLMETQQRIAEAVRTVDIELEDRPFSPHLTLGRVRSSAHMESLLQKLERTAHADLGTTDIVEVLLYKSVLGRDGAEHTVLHRTPLIGGPQEP